MDDGLLIRNAVIVDGSGAEPFPGDVLVRGRRIEAIGAGISAEGCEILDGQGCCLAPGFIDAHRHADLQVFSPTFGAAELAQGITTCACGNCGMSAAPCPPGREAELYRYLEPCLGRPVEQGGFPSFQDYVERLKVKGLPLNVASFVGGGTARIAVKGFDPSPMTAGELDRARGHIADAVEAGALGLSMGLMYAPECNYSQSELVELAAVAARRGGRLVMHIRGEGRSLAASVDEAIAIAGRAEIPLVISHFKQAGRGRPGALDRAIELIEAARARGQDVCCDAYPYAAGSTMLLTLLPPSLLSGGVDAALDTLRDRSARDRLRAELASDHDDWDNLLPGLGWGSVVVSSVSRPENGLCVGRSLDALAAEAGEDEVDFLCDLLIFERGRVGMVLHSMLPADVERVLRLPWCSVISDSIYTAAGNPHPRLYGSFPRVIREYVLEKRALTLTEAVRKMTSMPAERLGLSGRGMIRPGYAADLVVFHPDEVRDTATYAEPRQLAEGMRVVMLGGKIAFKDGKIQPEFAGKYIERWN